MQSKVFGEKPDVLRVAFPYAKPASAYEPARIELAPEYIFLENIFSPLVELSIKTGAIEPGVAESFRWEGNELHLKIRKNLQTVSGIKITAEDAEFSLKRLLAQPGNNTHGDFWQLICGNTKIKSVTDDCNGIRAESDELILKTTDAGKTFLLPMLAAIDFAIIPRSSVNPTTMKIENFKETSGPYYVSRDDDSGKIQLKANPSHYRYSSEMPQTIEFVPSDPKNPSASIEDFKKDRVDFVTTVDAARADDVIAASRNLSAARLHVTMNIRSFVLAFTKRGLAELSRQERFAIGRVIKAALNQKFAGQNGYENSSQFFPAFGEGGLNSDRMRAVEERLANSGAAPERPLSMTLIRLGDPTKFKEALASVLPNVAMSEATNSPSFTGDADQTMPHFYIAGPDTGFLEDIGLISYSLNAGYFGVDKRECADWLKAYMETPQKTDRLSLLQSLHEKALTEPYIVPLLVAPYAAIAKKPWSIGLSQLYANNPLWRLRAN